MRAAGGTYEDEGYEDEEVEEDEEYDDEEYEDYEETEEQLDSRHKAMVKRLEGSSRLFRQIGWISWWTQVVLSVVAAVILMFSNAVTDRKLRGNIFGNGVAMACLGVIASYFSVFWTWGYILKARRWGQNKDLKAGEAFNKASEVQRNIRRSLRLGVWINLLGMLLALVGAEQIVGTLVAKVLYTQGFQTFPAAAAAEVANSQFRALDVFVIQANTNTLLSHFSSLVAALGLLTRTDKITKPAKIY